MNRRLIRAILLQFSGTIGAGIFVLPYLFAHSNFLFSTLALLFLTFVMALLNITYAQVILHTQGDHQLSGYVHRYLGVRLKFLATFNVIFLGLGALVAYLYLAQNFLISLFPFLNPVAAFTIFVTLILIFHFDGFKPQESIISFLPYLTIFLVGLLLVSSNSYSSTLTNSLPSLLIIGPLVFSLSGFTIVPEIEEALRHSPHKKKEFSLAIVLGLVLVVFVYLAFIYAVCRISGPRLSPDSVTGIFQTSPVFGAIIAIFGLVTLFRSSLNFLFVFKEIFYRDFYLTKAQSYSLAAIAPFLAYTVYRISFIRVVSLVGTISTLIAAILICAILFKIKPKIPYKVITLVIILTFATGLLIELNLF